MFTRAVGICEVQTSHNVFSVLVAVMLAAVPCVSLSFLMHAFSVISEENKREKEGMHSKREREL